MFDDDDLDFLMVEEPKSVSVSGSYGENPELFQKVIEKGKIENEKIEEIVNFCLTILKPNEEKEIKLTDFLVNLSMEDLENEENFVDWDNKSKEIKDSLDVIFEDEEDSPKDSEENISSIRISDNFYNNLDTQHQDSLPFTNFEGEDSLPYSGDEEELLNSLFNEEIDVEKEKLILEEIDEFLKEKNRNYIKEKKLKIDRVEFEFQQFLFRRQREINIKDAREIIQKKILPKLKQVDDKILEEKEKHVNHIKVLRKYSKFQKGDLENFRNENLELKKKILGLKNIIKLLKVELRKSQKNEKNIPNETPIFRKKILDEKVIVSNLTRKRKSRNDFNSSVSTAASSLNLVEKVAVLKDENEALKRKINKSEEEFKIKMSRMKAFYDENLKILNSGSKLSFSKNQNLTSTCGDLKSQKIEKSQKESQIRLSKERIKTKKLKESLNKKETFLKNLKIEVGRLKSEIANLGRGKLLILNKKLKKIIERKNELIQKLKEENSLDFQLRKKYPRSENLIQKILIFVEKYNEFSEKSIPEKMKFYKKLGVRLAKKSIKILLYPISTILLKFSDFIKIQFSNIVIDKKKAIEEGIEKWKNEESKSGHKVSDLLREIFLLEKENENLRKMKEENDLQVQNIKMKGVYHIDILSKFFPKNSFSK